MKYLPKVRLYVHLSGGNYICFDPNHTERVDRVTLKDIMENSFVELVVERGDYTYYTFPVCYEDDLTLDYTSVMCRLPTSFELNECHSKEYDYVD